MSSSNEKHKESLGYKRPTDMIYKQKTSFWQSVLWADILRKTKQAEIIEIPSQWAKILLERRKIWGKYTGLYILWVDSAHIDVDFIDTIERNIRLTNDLFLQIEPLTPIQGTKASTAPFRRFIEPVTALLDLAPPEAEIMAHFAEKWRYNIRLAQKRGVTTRWVKASEACNEEWQKEKTYLEAFFNLLDETTKRDGFAHNSLAYYKHFVETLELHNAWGLLIAEKDGILHAAGIFAYWGDTAIYYYGASSSDTAIRRDMATYLLQWDAIREGIKRWCAVYDFLGISADGKGKLAGVTEFKLRFNPEKIYWPWEKVIIYKPFTLKALQCISRIRKMFR